MVVMFLFYSGYGVAEAVRAKGDDYVRAMPRHRVLQTLVNFDVAVCLFLVADMLLGREVTVGQFLLSLVAWDEIGNSNWYIFAIVACYAATWLCATMLRGSRLTGVAVLAVVTAVAVALHSVKDSYWYDTLWAYPTGFLFSEHRERAEALLNAHYGKALAALAAAFVAVYLVPVEAAGFRMNCLSVVFALAVVAVTMRVEVGNAALRWCGRRLFPLYIYQRLPMMVLAAVLPQWTMVQQPLLFIGLSLAATIAMAWLYRMIAIRL